MLRAAGISVQIVTNGTLNAVPGSGAVPSAVTQHLVIFGTTTKTIISLCNVEDIQFTTTDQTVINDIIDALGDTCGCGNTCAGALCEQIAVGGTIGSITTTTHQNLPGISNSPIVAKGSGLVLLREGTTGQTFNKYHLVSLCQVSALSFTPPPPPPPIP